MIDYGVFLDFLYDRVHAGLDDSLDPDFWDCFECNLDLIVSDFDRFLFEGEDIKKSLTSDNKCDNI